MEVFITIAMSLGLFASGVSLGAYLENKRLHSVGLIRQISKSLKTTQQILLPLADKITHYDMRQRQFINRTLVDYNNMRDSEITLEMPVYERESVTEELNLKEEQWLKKQRNWED
jgi:hypothetical protein